MNRPSAPRLDCPACGRSTAYSHDSEIGWYFLRRHSNPSTGVRCSRHVITQIELDREAQP